MTSVDSDHRCRDLMTMKNRITPAFGMRRSWVAWRRHMTDMPLAMDRKTQGSKMEGRGRRTRRKGKQRGRQRRRGKEVDMMKERHLNTEMGLKVGLDTRIGKTMAVQGGGRGRRLHSGWHEDTAHMKSETTLDNCSALEDNKVVYDQSALF